MNFKLKEENFQVEIPKEEDEGEVEVLDSFRMRS